MSESPEAIRKYMAPSPSPVTVRRMKVLMPASVDAEQRAHALRIPEQLLGAACMDDASSVEDDELLGNPGDDREILLDEEHRRELRGALERGRDLGHEQRRQTLGRLV